MKKTIILSALLGVLAISTPKAWAYTVIGGDCSSGPLWSAQEFMALQTSLAAIKSDILTVGQSLEETMKQGQASLEKQNEFLVDAIRKVTVDAEVARQTYKNNNTYGEASASRGTCQDFNLSTYVRQTMEAADQIRETLVKESEAQGKDAARASTTEARKYRLQTENVSLQPTGGYLTDEQLAETTRALNLVLDPVPSLQLSEKQQATMHGIQYKGATNLLEIRQKEARNVLFSVESLLAAKITDEDIIDDIISLNEEYGSEGPPLQVQNNEISLAGLLQFYSDLRFASPNWLKDVASKDPVFLQRESTKMQAMQLKLMYEIFKQLQSQTILQAQQSATDLGREKQAVNQYYRNVFENNQ